MAEQWTPIPINSGLFANLDEGAITSGMAAIENGFVNEQGGHTRFPGLIERADLGDPSRVYLSDSDNTLVAANAKGQIFRIDRKFNVTNVTGVPLSGGRRAIFAKTDKELLMAAGGPIIRLRAARTELLSRNAPLATHVGWIDGYTIATEVNSGRFFNSAAGQPDSWSALDTFSADGNPDNINSMLITPFRELMLGGSDSIEQFERLQTGTVPFFRRWAVGDGVRFPYVIMHADNAMWTINNLTEIVRFSGQQSASVSNEIGKMLESIDNWTDAWMGGYPDRPLNTVGQKFILIGIPNATNPYGTKGITIVYDYRGKRFATLYGWDQAKGVPRRWPGWSHWTLWGRVFVGGDGKIYELSDTTYMNGSELQRWLIRTAHISSTGPQTINDFRLRLKRGHGTSAARGSIRVRCSMDGKPFGPWISRDLGYAGDRLQYVNFGSFGMADHFAWEISSADNYRIDLMAAQVLATPVGH